MPDFTSAYSKVPGCPGSALVYRKQLRYAQRFCVLRVGVNEEGKSLHVPAVWNPDVDIAIDEPIRDKPAVTLDRVSELFARPSTVRLIRFVPTFVGRPSAGYPLEPGAVRTNDADDAAGQFRGIEISEYLLHDSENSARLRAPPTPTESAFPASLPSRPLPVRTRTGRSPSRRLEHEAMGLPRLEVADAKLRDDRNALDLVARKSGSTVGGRSSPQ